MQALTIIGIIVLLLLIFIAGPIFTIMAVNTLFDTGIPLTIGTWFAAFWIHIVFASKAIQSKVSR